MIVTAHQSAYLPWCGLIDKIAQADKFCIFDVCPQESSGFENRNRILGPTGEQWLTVPVHRDRHLPLSQVRVVKGDPWRRKHWRSIELAYYKAKFWNEYAPTFECFYTRDWDLLVDLTHEMLAWFLDRLGVAVPIVRASSIGCEGAKSALVLDMCKRLGATEYIFGALGKDYADVAAFKAAGIKVRFQEYKHPTYPQMRRGFVPNLSVLDLMMNCGPKSLEILAGR